MNGAVALILAVLLVSPSWQTAPSDVRLRCHTATTQHFSMNGRRRSVLLRSPVSPRTGRYRRNEDCRWLLRSDTPLRLTVEQVDIEPSLDCRHDSLRIYNAAAELPETPNVTVCGSAPVPPLVTRPGLTMVRFRSDASNEGTGFRLRLRSVTSLTRSQPVSLGEQPRPPPPEAVAATATAAAAVCNQTLEVTLAGGIIDSYRDPTTNKYLPNQDCFILLKSTSPIRLTFKNVLQLQDPSSDGICRADGLVVYNASFNMNDQPKNTSHIFCGVTDCNSVCNSLFTDGDAMLRFVTDGAEEFKGFTLQYELANRPPDELGAEQRHIVWGSGADGLPAGRVSGAEATRLDAAVAAALLLLLLLA